MYRIVYTSTSNKLMNERDLQRILRSARANNAANLITGMLIYHEGCFLQVLEGDQEAVERCYQHILKDYRHSNIIRMSAGTVTSRIFSDWWMSFKSFDSLSQRQQKQVVSLAQMAKQVRDGELTEDQTTHAILLAFLSGFRDLGMTG
jgi:hypothetical protein